MVSPFHPNDFMDTAYPGVTVTLIFYQRFDIFRFEDLDDRTDVDGMLESAQSLTQLIAAEVELGIPENRIVLGGFSQGAAMTLLTGLTFKGRLAALFVLSGRLPAPDTVRKVNSNQKTD